MKGDTEVTTRIELPHGGYCVLRDPDDITYGERRDLEKRNAKIGVRANIVAGAAGNIEVDAESMAEALVGSKEFGVTLFIAEWSYELPVPRTDPGSLLKIKPKDFDAISNVVEELIPQTFLQTEPTPDRASPTPPSGD